MQQMTWRKSSRSESEGNCVEIAECNSGVAVRDSKQPEGPHLQFEARAFGELLATVRAGRYNR